MKSMSLLYMSLSDSFEKKGGESIWVDNCLYWCAILIAHQLLWQNMEAPVSIFQESPLAGEPRERLFHIHSVNRYQLRTK